MKYKQHYRTLAFAIALLAILGSSQRATAGDLLFLLTSPVYQDSVVIGDVISTNKSELVFESKRVLLGDFVPSTLTIADYEPHKVEALSAGDSAVLSLVRTDRRGQYELTYTAFKVSSSVPAEAEIISGPLLGSERIAYNWFINSCGADRNFAFDYSSDIDTASLRKGVETTVMAQRDNRLDGTWTMIAKPLACEAVQISWWRALLKRIASASML